MQSTYRKRLRGKTGIVKDMFAAMDAANETKKNLLEDEPVPAPPKAYDEAGVFYKLPEGHYYPDELWARVFVKNCKSSMFALRLIHYRCTWGRKWEERCEEEYVSGIDPRTVHQRKIELGYWWGSSP